jgi:hypothetical protein
MPRAHTLVNKIDRSPRMRQYHLSIPGQGTIHSRPGIAEKSVQAIESHLQVGAGTEGGLASF